MIDHLLAAAERGDRLLVRELDHHVVPLLDIRLGHTDEGLRERHGPVGRPEVEEAA